MKVGMLTFAVDVIGMASRAEGLGFDAFWVPEHVVIYEDGCMPWMFHPGADRAWPLHNTPGLLPNRPSAVIGM